MKQKLKRLRPWLLSVTALLLLVNCAEELALPTNRSTEGNAARHKILHGREAAEKKNDLVAHLKQPGGRGMANLAAQLGSSPNFRKLEDVAHLIDSTEVYEIKFENGDANYTYRFNDPKANDASFYNIVFKRRGTASKSVIVHYEMETAFVDEFYSGSKGIEGMTGNIHFEPLGADDGFPCEEEPNIPIPINGGMGPGGGGGNGSGTGPITIGEGVNGIGTNYGYSYNQVVVTIQYMGLYLNIDTAIEVSRSPRYFRVPAIDPGLVGPNDPCGGEDEIGILEPELPDPHEKNCEELRKMTEQLANGNKIRNKIIELQSVATDDDIKDEAGFALEHSDTTDTVTLDPEPLEPASTSLGEALAIKYGGRYYGVLHIHPYPVPGDPKKHTPMFTTSDIFYFGYIAKKYNTNGQPKDYSKFVLTLTVAGGSDNGAATSTYALKIENYMEFLQFLTAYYNMSKRDKEKFDFRLADEYTKLQERSPSSSPNDYMKVLFKFMERNNMRGFAIYKASDDLTQWEKQVYNPADNKITSTPCP